MKPAFKCTRRGLIAAAACLALPIWAQAGAFPDRAVTMVVPYPAGGSLDTVGRPLTQLFEIETGQPLILENVGGAGGLIAAAKVVQAKPGARSRERGGGQGWCSRGQHRGR